MEPYHSHREWLVLERIRPDKNWTPNRYDVVVFHAGGDRLTKRVIGLPGDTIEIRDGYIYLNNQQLSEHGNFGSGRIYYILVGENDEALRYSSGPQVGEIVITYVEKGSFVVPEGHFWAIGDNRSMSWYGLGKIKDIIGVSLL
jgi:signal peptidase I